MSNPIFFAPLRTPLVDLRTGIINREWYLLFQAMFTRIGGATAPDNSDLESSISDLSKGASSGTEELRAALLNAQDAVSQLPIAVPLTPDNPLDAQLAELREIVAEQAKQIQALQQGVAL